MVFVRLKLKPTDAGEKHEKGSKGSASPTPTRKKNKKKEGKEGKAGTGYSPHIVEHSMNLFLGKLRKFNVFGDLKVRQTT